MAKYVQKTECPKCGSDLLTTEYDKITDVLRRKCSNCSAEFNVTLREILNNTKEVWEERDM